MPSIGRIPALVAALLTGGLLFPVQRMVSPPMLLAERFVPGAGWIELVAALHAVFLGLARI